ncbi:hypothetical protein [Aestuariimicrobium sp. Y1814]|uniref:hypothetical protein n=1 Tax=Aestuariimicrobium sp. Y1814 TaxID=3418742 RepID=UPI003DA73177
MGTLQATRRAAVVPHSRPSRWTSLRRWFARIQWDQVAQHRDADTRALRHEAEQRRLFGSLR